jgi:ribosomal protein S18 acetylase RimI-like enzyme
MVKIRTISILEAITVRHPVLRFGKPIATCHFDGDNEPTTKHFGLFETDNLVGIITVLENNLAGFEDKKQFQLRGMAVLESHQKMGFGLQLLRFTELHIKNQSGTLIWCNARTAAVAFYEKAGYTKSGPSFEIQEIGLHFKMFKKC